MLELKYKQHADNLISFNTFSKETVLISNIRFAKDLLSVQFALPKRSCVQCCHIVDPNALHQSGQGKENKLKIMVQ